MAKNTPHCLLRCTNMLLFCFSNARNEMSRFATRVSEDLQKECCAAMLNNNMILFGMRFHAQKVEGSQVSKMNKEAKRAKSSETAAHKSSLDVQDKPKVKKRFTNKVLSNVSNNHKQEF